MIPKAADRIFYQQDRNVHGETSVGKSEDSIPVIEIRGEGKPMTAAQIRHLEEVEKTWVPAKCETPAKRKDFVTFHYKVFTENGRKVYQTYNEGPVTMQLGVGMTMPGLDKGLKGMCAEELRKLQVPYRLSRKAKSKVWKNIPNDEHWLTFNLEMLSVEPYSHSRQFKFLDVDGKGKLTEAGLLKWLDQMKEYGKTWKNEDIDNVLAVKYYIKYFDINGDGVIDEKEFTRVMQRDEAAMEQSKSKAKGRKRDPGVAWILDFDNDGIASYKEVDDAPELLEKGPTRLPTFKDEL
ncbi:peptidyl-prolyl cis-trans isomerase, FKBP-type [Ancylostoma caninum]|uniref:peptidylprolyl isomerase n=2 Tax=Ancylostoma TaxID=29169 RepID=A0A368FNP0_ANCCA|nr:peptidyl-prolyl cis-trans isomerase, FKBP-type [Ancylostoma caninum]